MDNNYKKIELPGRGYASFLVPELNENEELSVVSTEVLKKIISFLPREHFLETKNDLIHFIRSCNNMEEYCKLLQDELSFHSSINLIESFFKDDHFNKDYQTKQDA